MEKITMGINIHVMIVHNYILKSSKFDFSHFKLLLDLVLAAARSLQAPPPVAAEVAPAAHSQLRYILVV